MGYVIRVEATTYVCKGSYVYEGEKYKVIDSLDHAKEFKTKESAEKELDRLRSRFINIDDECVVMEVED